MKSISDRILWLTDTFDDRNGVSMVLQSIHQEITKRNLPIDILVCSNKIKARPNLLVVKPVAEFSLPFYRQQPICIPGFFNLKRLFLRGGYNRIISSTEGPMGMAALYLRKTAGAKSFCYLHTDWLMFAQTAMKIGKAGISVITRFLRFYYKSYDGIFVLNTDQQKWLSGKTMKFDESRVFLTAHWVDEIFAPKKVSKMEVLGLPENTPVLLFAGRLSLEKGIMELPGIFRKVIQTIPNLKMVIAGNGPAADKLKEIFPEAIFTGWIDHDQLPGLFSASDLLILPSRFDTFSCSVLEALSCGLPVIAYNTKGPKDIIQHGVCGFLADDSNQMAMEIQDFFMDDTLHEKMRQAARERSKTYNAGEIFGHFLKNVGMPEVAKANV
jgi:glycosyltransferase involved in cell wall biosynthesis